MKPNRLMLAWIQLAALLFLLAPCFSVHGAEPAVGSQLPQLTFGPPESPEVQKYLGLKSMDSFKLSAIGAKIVMMEFFNVF